VSPVDYSDRVAASAGVRDALDAYVLARFTGASDLYKVRADLNAAYRRQYDADAGVLHGIPCVCDFPDVGHVPTCPVEVARRELAAVIGAAIDMENGVDEVSAVSDADLRIVDLVLASGVVTLREVTR
jgi:hypothetical protein